MPQSLPPRPDLEQLRRQAKELLAAWRAEDPEALAELERNHPQHHTRPRELATLRLADAQLVLARRYGQRSWSALRDEVELRALSFGERAAKLVAHAAAPSSMGGEAWRIANLLLDREPELAGADPVTALVCGDVARVRRWLAADPTRARAPIGAGDGRPPLCWVTFSRLHRRTPTIAAGLLELATLLLDLGAEVDAGFTGDETWGSTLRPLFGACGAANFPAMAELLLDRGAMIEDGESLYHALEHGDTRCLELLLARGANAAATNILAHAFDAPGLRRVELLLAHGADANARMHDGTPMLHRAIVMDRGLDVIEALLAAGAEPDARDRVGRTSLEVARAHGARAIAERLREAGGHARPSALADFVDACAAGDLDRARSLADAAGLRTQPGFEAVHVFLDVAGRPDPTLVLAMIDAGFPVDVTNHLGQGALHWAAWRGRAVVVRRLLDAGAQVERREQQFNGTPLAWAAHGNLTAPRDGGDHLAVVRMLLDAGADPSVRNKAGEPMLDETDDSEVASLLRSAGAP